MEEFSSWMNVESSNILYLMKGASVFFFNMLAGTSDMPVFNTSDILGKTSILKINSCSFFINISALSQSSRECVTWTCKSERYNLCWEWHWPHAGLSQGCELRSGTFRAVHSILVGGCYSEWYVIRSNNIVILPSIGFWVALS